MSTGLPLANCNPCQDCPPVPAVLTPCVDSEPCEELSLLGCVKYNGDTIVDGNIVPGERLDSILQKLMVAHINGIACISPTLKCVTNLRSTVVSANSITLAWLNHVDIATSVLNYKTESANTWTTVNVLNKTTEQLTGLLANTKYLFKIVTTGSNNVTCTSVTIAVTTKAS